MDKQEVAASLQALTDKQLSELSARRIEGDGVTGGVMPNRMLPPGEKDDPDRISILEMYDRYIAYVRHENDLLNQRTTWLVLTQAGFLTILCYMLQKYFEVIIGFLKDDSLHINRAEIVQMSLFMLFWAVICGAGLWSLAYAKKSINAAYKAQVELKNRWEREGLFLRAERLKFPHLLGGGDPEADQHGAEFAKSFPRVLIGVWVILFLVGLAMFLFTLLRFNIHQFDHTGQIVVRLGTLQLRP